MKKLLKQLTELHKALLLEAAKQTEEEFAPDTLLKGVYADEKLRSVLQNVDVASRIHKLEQFGLLKVRKEQPKVDPTNEKDERLYWEHLCKVTQRGKEVIKQLQAELVSEVVV